MEYNDYELVALAHESNEEAMNILYEKYMPLIVKKAKEVYPILCDKGLELEDIIQECSIGFEEAIRSFDQDDGAMFYTFVCVCVDRQIKSMIVKNNRYKYKFLNEAISLEVSDVFGDEKSFLDFMASSDESPEDYLISLEKKDSFYEKVQRVLTDYELGVLKYRLDGYSYEEIGKIFDKDAKSIDNTLHRVRIKLKKFKDYFFE